MARPHGAYPFLRASAPRHPVVLTPHIASGSPEAIAPSFSQFLENTRRFPAGEPLLTPQA